jgi:16S rRNA processing protein RimM
MSDQIFSRAIGVIGRSYGLKGYVFVQLYTSYPDSFKKNDILFLNEECTYKILLEDVKNLSIKGGKKRLIWKFSGIDNKNDSDNLKNTVIFRHFSNQPKLRTGTFWADDLIGCDVLLLSDGKILGRVTGVENLAYNDNLIMSTSGRKTDTIPMTDEYIGNIDIGLKQIFIKKIPEYI